MENEFGLTSWITDAGVVHIDVHGELDADTADRLVNALGIYREPLTHCVIDLSCECSEELAFGAHRKSRLTLVFPGSAPGRLAAEVVAGVTAEEERDAGEVGS